ncbi:MAG TPA: hypothetical protein VKF36_03500 [Syntrophorhabdales bacterium]|nr:hypothetical protein [Syntrophorhabdales bacterium]
MRDESGVNNTLLAQVTLIVLTALPVNALPVIRKLFFLGLVLLCTGTIVQGRAVAQPFPEGALIIEQRNLPKVSNRALVLWMLKPHRSDPIPEDDPYTCPDETRGSAYSGPTRVSLVDVATGAIINTVEIRDPHFPDKDSFDIPYEMRPGYYYLVIAPARGKKAGEPTILNYRDYNGDGEAAEFALYDAPFCMGLQTALIGYSRRQDRVLQYPLDVKFTKDKESWREESLWLEYIFSEKPVAPGHYRFKVDYRGRGGSLLSYDVKYDKASERFHGTCVITDR